MQQGPKGGAEAGRRAGGVAPSLQSGRAAGGIAHLDLPRVRLCLIREEASGKASLARDLAHHVVQEAEGRLLQEAVGEFRPLD